MASWKEAVTARLQQVVGAANKKALSCWVCSQTSWILADLVMLPTREGLQPPSRMEQALFLAPLVCQNCGNTILLNILTLGAVEVVSEGEEPTVTFDEKAVDKILKQVFGNDNS